MENINFNELKQLGEKQKTNSVAFSQQVNYTDQATTTGR
jgi:hypothetical protein